MIFVDLSNFVFHRYLAIVSWASLQKGKEFSDEYKKDMFKRLFLKSIRKLVKDTKVPWSQVYLARDCPRSEIWRNEHFPEYKMNRKKNAHFDWTMFDYTYDHLVPILVADGAHLVKCDRAEADDVIAVLKRKMRALDVHHIIYIVSSDRDYLQLLDDFTFIVDANGKRVEERAGMIGATNEVFMLAKIIGGDQSDNIPAIDKKIGPKSAISMAKDPVKLSKRLESPEVRRQFDINDTIINFDRIPADIREAIEKQLMV